MTFREYIIQEKSEYFLHLTEIDMKKCKTKKTLEEWFPEMYLDWKIITNQQ